MKARNTKGFTLVEIMIVVVIIGLLAAMAIPAFQKVRQNSIEKTLANDARQIASAANQYYLENGASNFSVGVIPASGEIADTSDLYDFVKYISKGNSFPVALTINSGFSGTNAALGADSIVNFSSDGQKL
jgi:type IV pilus assembly protein PilA